MKSLINAVLALAVSVPLPALAVFDPSPANAAPMPVG